ncbi:acetyl-CoA carboxylase biotin carboxylase subunit family protein [Streptomyces sp. NBC_00102]|uniref:ATP-grasp domain-containing protein n=1 Tax=Streptomyces sp. NBC_00102 TaxID=2975652 RepID=UPI00224E1322|nr:ATP-grasp domain-containing protein [Streptomyces sp. NBC_00102]MCX5398294.1 ATP-grasp domain-containing protein [Streptomyces sp. NBC_00102]
MTIRSQHVVVLHRWRDHYARYEDYIDHRIHRVTYVTTALARESIPVGAAGTVTVRATDDLPAVLEAVSTLSVRFGAPDLVMALNEGDLETAALLRGQLGCPGQSYHDLAPFRDKLIMAEVVHAAGVRTPAFADAPDSAAVKEFTQTHGWPVVVKPRRGTASRGVMRLESPEDLPKLEAAPAESRVVQEYVEDAIYHVDGVWTGTELGPWRASRYLNTCVDFTDGAVLGSIEEDDPDVLGPIGEFTASVGRALGGRQPWVFHLEVFVGTEEDGSVRLTFLEVGWRVGGAEIPFVWREVHGLDLAAAAADVQLGNRPGLETPENWQVGGWLLVPSPVPPPCKVVAASVPLPGDGGPYTHVVPAAGDVLPKVGGYEHVGIRMRFQGATSQEVRTAVETAARETSMVCVPHSPPRSACGLDR